MKIDEIVHGFRLIRSEEVKEAEGTAYTFVHEKTGARLFFLETADDNKVFSISFRTPPVDDTGVAHIVEHSVLCGSRKYPLKEPFVELVKGSLNTFLAAHISNNLCTFAVVVVATRAIFRTSWMSISTPYSIPLCARIRRCSCRRAGTTSWTMQMRRSGTAASSITR